jgi:hypothetical protein
MTAAPVGAEVRIFVDLVARVAIGDAIETQTGRRYGVVAVRVQLRVLDDRIDRREVFQVADRTSALNQLDAALAQHATRSET